MDNFSAGGIGASIVAALGLIYAAINHKRVRSNCCGKQTEISIDVETTTPVKKPDPN